MLSAVKIRLYPNSEQRTALGKQFGCVRWLYNWGLEQARQSYQESGRTTTYYSLSARLPNLKQDHPWLSEADSQALQQTLQHLAAAFDSYFKGRSEYPSFKSKNGRQSCSYPQRVKIAGRRDNGWGSLYLPKIGAVRCKFHRGIVGKMKTVTISRDSSGAFYASILTDDGAAPPSPTVTGPSVGIDVGLTHFAIMSNGRKVKNPRFRAREDANLKRKQKKLARTKPGSNRRTKARLALAKSHERVARSRKDFLHKLSRQLVNENQVIAVEDLNVRGMMANHRLSKAIGDAGWSAFVRMLSYKAEREGKVVVRCHRFFPSSKTCSCCGHVEQHMPLDVRKWTCRKCGCNHDRDINAAINIRNEALRTLAEGCPAAASGGSVRR